MGWPTEHQEPEDEHGQHGTTTPVEQRVGIEQLVGSEPDAECEYTNLRPASSSFVFSISPRRPERRSPRR